jgi:hypothetical protein
MKAEIDKLIATFAGRYAALDVRLALARDLAECIDDPETPTYVKVGLSRELNKLLLQMPLQ